MHYIEGEDRGQATLLPAVIDEYVAPDSVVRVIDLFADRLDYRGLGFRRAVPAETGRPGYRPSDLLKLYLYGYANEVQSSRKLERECQRNVELMWLLKRLAPDFKTIADFRRDHPEALAAACAAFIRFCREHGLPLGRLVAIDGSKFRAAASARRVVGEKSLTAQEAQIAQAVAEYLAVLEGGDAAEADQPTGAQERQRAAHALERLRAQQDTIAAQRAELAASGRSTIIDGEREARLMGVHRPKPAYNVQIGVDAETGLIVHHTVTDDCTDSRQLFTVARGAQQALGGGSLQVIADRGYANGEEVAKCEAQGIAAAIPARKSVQSGDFFDRSAFTYVPEQDAFRCPAGQLLRRSFVNHRFKLTAYTGADCAACALKPQCTAASRRWVSRHLYEDALARMNARVQADPGLMHRRRCTVEHPFGTLKRRTAGGRFLTRGLRKVSGETALRILTYNLLRAVKLAGTAPLCSALA